MFARERYSTLHSTLFRQFDPDLATTLFLTDPDPTEQFAGLLQGVPQDIRRRFADGVRGAALRFGVSLTDKQTAFLNLYTATSACPTDFADDVDPAYRT